MTNTLEARRKYIREYMRRYYATPKGKKKMDKLAYDYRKRTKYYSQPDQLAKQREYQRAHYWRMKRKRMQERKSKK